MRQYSLNGINTIMTLKFHRFGKENAHFFFGGNVWQHTGTCDGYKRREWSEKWVTLRQLSPRHYHYKTAVCPRPFNAAADEKNY